MMGTFFKRRGKIIWSGSPEKGFPHPLLQEHVDVLSIDSAEKVMQVWAVETANDIGKYQVSITE